MPDLTIDIAGLPVLIEGLTAALEAAALRRYRPFLTSGKPAVTVGVTYVEGPKPEPEGDPQVERVAPGEYSVRWGALSAQVSVRDQAARGELLENVYMLDSLLRISMSLLLLERGGLLLHSSGVMRDGRVLISFGPSGAGKTTVARSVPEADVLCDEVMALLPQPDGSVRAIGTPFHGDLGICAPGAGPVAAIVRLRQAARDRLTPLSTAAAAREMLAATLFFCREPDLAGKLLDIAAIVCKARTFSLEFQLTTHVPSFVFEHLGRNAAETQPKIADPGTGG